MLMLNACCNVHADIRNAHSVSTIVECLHLKSPAGIVHKHIKDITDWCNSVTLPKLRRLVQSHQKSSYDNLQLMWTPRILSPVHKTVRTDDVSTTDETGAMWPQITFKIPERHGQRPIRGQCLGHVINIDQSEASIQLVTWPLTYQSGMGRGCAMQESSWVSGQWSLATGGNQSDVMSSRRRKNVADELMWCKLNNEAFIRVHLSSLIQHGGVDNK